MTFDLIMLTVDSQLFGTLFVCSDVRQLTLTQRTCPPNVVVQRIRSAVLSTIIPVLSTILLISSAVKYP